VRLVGAGFDDGVDPSRARRDIEHVDARDLYDRGVDLDHERFGFERGDAGIGHVARGGVPNDLGRSHHDDVTAGVGLGRHSGIGGTGELGGLQRLDRHADARRPDGRLDLQRELRG
jgi:hypothetical protein